MPYIVRTARTASALIRCRPVRDGSVELALVDRVGPRRDDLADVGEPDLVARGSLDRCPACEAGVRREQCLGQSVPARVESVRRAPGRDAVPRSAPHAGVGGIGLAGHPRQRQRDRRTGRRLERVVADSIDALVEVRCSWRAGTRSGRRRGPVPTRTTECGRSRVRGARWRGGGTASGPGCGERRCSLARGRSRKAAWQRTRRGGRGGHIA